MKIKGLRFDKHGALDGVTMRMSMDEAAFLVKLLAGVDSMQADEVMSNGAAVSNEMFDCLVGDLFNKHFDDGVNEYLARG